MESISYELTSLEQLSKNELIGMLIELIADKNDSRIQSDLLYELVGKYVQINKALNESIEEVKRLSITDNLTGLYNRLYFNRAFDKEMDRFNRYEQKFSLIMLDIDHFKKVNDTYGHNVGDEVLVQISKILLKTTRKPDVCARWGGEEFIVLFTNCNKDYAIKAAERLRKAVEKADFGVVGHITASLGVTEVMVGDDVLKCTKRADEALYKAKKEGRNKVIYG